MRLFRLLLLIILSPGLAHTQQLPDFLPFEQIQVPGVIQSALTEDIIQDEYGMIWVAKNILYRYNGRDFKKQNFSLPDSVSLSSREITSLCWDSGAKRLLVGTRNSGILQFRYETDKLEPLTRQTFSPIINKVAQDDRKTIWASSFSGGLYQLRDDSLVKMASDKDLTSPTDLLVGKNELWVACINEVVVFRKDRIRKRISIRPYTEYISNSIRASALHFDTKGNLWIGTERDGIIVLDTATHQLIKRFSPREKPFYSSITRIAQDDIGLIWILTKDAGLILFSPASNTWKQFTKSENEPIGLSGDFCTSMHIDATGIVWVGAAGPLNKYDRTKVKFEHINYNQNKKISLTDDNIRGIYKDESGKIYLATSSGKINIVDRKEGTVEKIDVKVPNSSDFVTPLAIHRLDKKTLLIGTSDGLLQYDLSTKRLDYYPPLRKLTEGHGVRQILQHGNLLILPWRSNLIMYDLQTGAIHHLTDEQRIARISHIAIDNEDRLWVGIGDGLAYRKLTEDKLQRINLQKSKYRPDSSTFLFLTIRAIKDELWVGTFNHGIFILDLKQPTPTLKGRLTINDGLPDNTVYATIPDAAGHIWIAHNSGLSRYEPETKSFTHFSVSEGLQDEEFNRLASFVDSKGEIILGGINGINIFDPSKISLSKINLDVRLFGVRLANPSGSPTYLSLLDSTSTRKINHGQNTVQFDFFVPDYHDPIRYRTYYQLTPIDRDWIESENLSSATYANLTPGTYTFHVKAVGPQGESNATSATLQILPPIWRTWWFISISVGLLATALYFILSTRIKKAERDRTKLEALLKIRTQEIEKSREELRNLNKKKDLIFSILSHDLRSPLTTLKGFLGLLVDDTDAISKEDLRKYAATIRLSVANSLDLIDNTLYWSLSQTGNIQCIPGTVFLEAIFDKIKGLYELTAEKKKISLHFPDLNGIAVHADENMVYVVLRNIISNAIKFSPEGKSIRVGAMQQGALVVIQIKDEGIGMTADEINKIFEFDNPVQKRGTASEKGTGLGLLLCKKFIEANQGRLLIESQEGSGSEFTVILPKA
jgi:signal transduction histidine kinase/ligand-binding sensor domain-containing protein